MAKSSGGTRSASGGASGAARDGRSARLTKALAATEASIRNERTENSFIFDEQGNEVYRSGRNAEQRFSSDPKLNALMNKVYNGSNRTFLDESKITNNIITHNHPNNKSFSNEDLHAAIGYNASEIRAVGPTRTYSLKRGSKGWSADDRTVGMEYGRLSVEMRKSDNRYVARYKGDKRTAQRRAEATLEHRVMKQVAKQFGLNYSSFSTQ